MRLIQPNLNNRPRPKVESRNLLLALIFLIIIVGLLMTSCITDRQRAKICAACPTKDSIVVKDSIRIERHDSTVYITSEPVLITIPSPCDSAKLKVFDLKQKKNGIKQEIKSDGKTIEFDCNADSLKQIIAGLNIERTLLKASFEEHIRTTNVCPITWWNQTYKYGFWSLLLLLLSIFGYKLFRLYLKAQTKI